MANGKRFEVCKKMFLSTVAIKKDMVRNWLYKGKGNNNNSKKPINHSDRTKHLISFLNQLPKVESHYCRQRSSQVYIDEQYRSKTDVYKSYM